MLRIHTLSGSKLVHKADLSRADVVAALERGTNFSTAVDRGAGYNLGEDVRVVVVGGVKYLRTDSNGRASDNLGALPNF